MLAEAQSKNARFRSGRHDSRTGAGWAFLVAYTLILVYWVHAHGAESAVTKTLIQELQDSHWLARWMGGLVLKAFREFAYFVPVGFVAALMIPRRSGYLRRLPISLPALAVASALSLSIYAVQMVGSWYWAAAVGLLCPLLGCLLGTWAGATWLRGWRPCLWFLPKVASLALLAVLGAGVIVWLSLQRTPLPFEPIDVTSVEKRRLTHLVHDKSPESLKQGQTHTLRLTEHDVNVLLSWGLSLQFPERKAMVRMDSDAISLFVSMAVPLGRGRCRYLNLRVTGRAGIEDGTLELRVQRCRIGPAEVPPRLLHCLGSLAASSLSHGRQLKPFLEATKGIVIDPNSVELTYGPLNLPAELRERFLRPALQNEGLLASTRTQVDRLLLLFTAGPMPDLQPSFNLCLKTAFALARDRSADGNPVAENQAAIFALGVLLGHPNVEDFVGPVVATRDHDAVQQVLGRVLLRGRSDWTRHFCVSAVIAILSDKALSDAAGLLKEERDAEVGGHGFSFADLLADRAGTTFALSATRDEAAARAMQDRLAGGFRIDDVFPAPDGLPEGIFDAELRSRYGGVGGEPYRGLIKEIERRVTGCAAYQ